MPMKYVDGYVLPLPKKNIEAYRKTASIAAKIWVKHGALAYFEAIGEDLNPKFGLPFPKLVKPKAGETIVFAWILFKSRAHRDKVNAKVMADTSMEGSMDHSKPPFDFKRMSYGGFDVIVEDGAKKPKKRPATKKPAKSRK